MVNYLTDLLGCFVRKPQKQMAGLLNELKEQRLENIKLKEQLRLLQSQLAAEQVAERLGDKILTIYRIYYAFNYEQIRQRVLQQIPQSRYDQKSERVVFRFPELKQFEFSYSQLSGKPLFTVRGKDEYEGFSVSIQETSGWRYELENRTSDQQNRDIENLARVLKRKYDAKKLTDF